MFLFEVVPDCLCLTKYILWPQHKVAAAVTFIDAAIGNENAFFDREGYVVAGDCRFFYIVICFFADKCLFVYRPVVFDDPPLADTDNFGRDDNNIFFVEFRKRKIEDFCQNISRDNL